MLKNSMKVVKNKFDRGKGSALKTGFVLSSLFYKLHDNDIVIFLDGDGQIEPQEIKTFLNLMELYNADVVIGNKRHAYSIIHYNPARKIVSSAYNIIVRFLFGLRYEDTQCGIKIFKKHALDRVIERVTTKKFAFDLELIIALREMKMRVADAPVNIKQQLNEGSVSFLNIFHTFMDTLSIFQRMKKGFYHG